MARVEAKYIKLDPNCVCKDGDVRWMKLPSLISNQPKLEAKEDTEKKAPLEDVSSSETRTTLSVKQLDILYNIVDNTITK